MATQPTLKVEFAPTNTPLETAPTWVDITAYVRESPGVTISRGRGERAESFDAGHCQLTLDNRTRRFDPSYSAGPYFGNLIPRKRIRLTATWSAVDYVAFTGWVTGWPQGFGAGGRDATVTLDCVDAIPWLANNNLPNDLVYTYANTTIGSLAFFLRGADTATWSDAKSSGRYATVSAGTGRTTGGLAPGMASTAISLDANIRWVMALPYVSAGAWSLAFWVQTTATQPTNTMFEGNNGTGANSSTVYVGAGATFGQVVFSGDGYSFNSPTTGQQVNDGIAHHVVMTSDGSTVAGAQIYIDGIAVTTTTSGGAWKPLSIDHIGYNIVVPITGSTFTGTLQDVAVWDKQLSAAEVTAFYARSKGFLAESSATRVTRLLDDVGWPATWREITTTQRATVDELVYNGASALSKLQEVADRSEQGRLFITKAGYVAFRERYYANEVTVGNTVQQVFSDDGGANDLPFSTFQFQFNDVDVTNAASVTTPVTRAASSDSTSITAYGLQSKQVDTNLSTFDQANSMAAGLVARGRVATYRVAPILVYPANNTTRWDDVLLLELGYRMQMQITPMAVGSQNSQEVTLERIEWLIENDLWSLTVAGSPAPVSGTAYSWFVVNLSLVGSTTDLIGF